MRGPRQAANQESFPDSLLYVAVLHFWCVSNYPKGKLLRSRDHTLRTADLEAVCLANREAELPTATVKEKCGVFSSLSKDGDGTHGIRRCISEVSQALSNDENFMLS